MTPIRKQSDVWPFTLHIQNGEEDKAIEWIDDHLHLINVKDPEYPLVTAASRGRTRVVAHLIEKKAEVNVRTFDGATPLILATAQGHDIEALLKAKADPNLGPKNGENAFWWAKLKDRVSCIALLIKHGALPLTNEQIDSLKKRKEWEAELKWIALHGSNEM